MTSTRHQPPVTSRWSPPIHLDSSQSGTCWRRYVQPPRPQRSIADLRRRPSAPPPGTSSFSVGRFRSRGVETPMFLNGAIFLGEAASYYKGSGYNNPFEQMSQNGNIISQMYGKTIEVCSIYNSENMNHTSKHCGNKIPSRYGKLI